MNKNVFHLNIQGAQCSQKDAVYLYITETLGRTTFNSSADVKKLMTKPLREKVVKRLYDSFKNNQINLSKNYTDAKLKEYCSGLVSYWMERDKRFSKDRFGSAEVIRIKIPKKAA